MDIIVDGKKYKLVPVEDAFEDYKAVEEKVETSEGTPQPSVSESVGVRKAVPKVSDYRERYKKRQVMMSEVTAPPRRVQIKQRDSVLEGYNYKGESLIFGEGLSEDIT